MKPTIKAVAWTKDGVMGYELRFMSDGAIEDRMGKYIANPKRSQKEIEKALKRNDVICRMCIGQDGLTLQAIRDLTA